MATIATDHQEFSFPTIMDPCSHAIDSPPLWHLSPAASPLSCHVKTSKGSEEENNSQELESNSWQKKVLIRTNDHDKSEEDEKEEKMDMLWEDFNEELLRNRSRSNSPHGSSRLLESHVCCIQQLQALRLSKSRQSKPGFVVLINVLKKVFLIHSSHSSVRTRTPRKVPVKV